MNRLRGSALVGLLAAIVIIAILVTVAMYGQIGPRESRRPDGLGKTVQGNARMSALDLQCRSNLQQIRAAIQIYTTTEDAAPPELQTVERSSDMRECPIGHEAYEYNPSDGSVKCPHPGHEKY